MDEDRFIREKLVNQGAASLTDAELVSVVIREGRDGLSALGLSEKILQTETLSQLARKDLKALRMTAGLGVKRAAVLAAALELGRRMRAQEAGMPEVIATNDDVARIFRPAIAGLPHEEFWVLYLSSANTVVGKEKVSQGGVSGTVVDHRLVIKRAIELLASGIILVHNHPSGVAQPSDDDKRLTRKIAEAASLFDIPVLDHLIVTTGDCFSFRQAGLVE